MEGAVEARVSSQAAGKGTELGSVAGADPTKAPLSKGFRFCGGLLQNSQSLCSTGWLTALLHYLHSRATCSDGVGAKMYACSILVASQKFGGTLLESA